MSTRYIYPELFHVTTQEITVGEKIRTGLRWIIHPSLGLPRALFKVWKYDGTILPKRINANVLPLELGKLISWSDGPAAMVTLVITVPAGTATFNAYSATNGTGHLVDQKTITGPIASTSIVLHGCPVSSIILTGNASIETVKIIHAQDFVNDPGWKLVEEVGLPVESPLFDSTGYPLTPQGPIAAQFDPVKAAVIRVKKGTPDNGWKPLTDRGTVPPEFIKPDAERLVKQELTDLMKSIAILLKEVPDPALHANKEVEIITTAPRSIHEVAASAHWQQQARPAIVKPLSGLLVTAGLDPFAALALGFGTTLGEQTQQVGLAASSANRSSVFMVTVQHKITQKIKLSELLPEISFTLDGELVAFCFRQKSSNLVNPQAVTTLTLGQPRVDPPKFRDGPWMRSVNLNWLRQVVPIAWMARPTGYAVASQMPGKPLEMRIEKRISGGWISFTPALSPDNNQPASVQFTDQNIPEPLPGQPPGQVYSVAGHDWFGRWSSWISTDNTRSNVAVQIPGLFKIDLLVNDGATPIRQANASVEFSWDWTNRRPEKITIRLLVHKDGLPAPAVGGSVLSAGGAVALDHVMDFSSATKENPPAGVTLLPDESSDELKKYKINISGITVDYGSNERTRITARARGSERFDPPKSSQWSKDVSTVVISPIPPPPPFVPATMLWSSIPDPKGISRTTLKWGATAPKYAIYVADETALSRELDLPSPDLKKPAAERLPALRSIDIQSARRAFRKIADNLNETELKVELPRGSKLIHFYGIAGITNSGVEGPLAVQANDYIAVASPRIGAPETPLVIARYISGRVSLTVKVSEMGEEIGRIEIFGSQFRYNTISIESMGPPKFVLNDIDGNREGGYISWSFDDADSYPPWKSVFYRAVAHGKNDLVNGKYGGKSLPSGTAEVAIESTISPTINAVLLEDGLAPGFKLLSFKTDASLMRTPRGVHSLSIKTYDSEMKLKARSINTDNLPLIKEMPMPNSPTYSIFRFDPVQPSIGRNFAWVDNNVKTVIIEVKDPLGRITTETKNV